MTVQKKALRQAHSKKTGLAKAYLHGFSKKEQNRLYTQARFFESSVFKNIDFSKQNKIIEVGCGVGAQTEILLERFPHLKIEAVDASKAQLKRASVHLAQYISNKKVNLKCADALHLPFENNSFDGAFLCWFLEHVQNPIEILQEIRRVLKVGAVIYCNEVLNATFYLHPYSPATLQYWFAFNDFQWTMKGDPFVGGKLANYLLKAGFQNITTQVIVHHYDSRTPKMRAQIMENWLDLLLSGAPQLLEHKKVSPKTIEEMKKEINRFKDDPDAVFFYSWVQARAEVF